MAASPHHQPCLGAVVGFVFICPGRFEAARGYPCAAGTGANLARTLKLLNAGHPQFFSSSDRSKYVVTNSWEAVEYPALTGRSVPDEAEVLQAANLSRLQSDIEALTVIVACGAQAHAAVKALAARGAIHARVAYARHLSQRSVNMIRGATDTPGRLALWCSDVMAQIDRPIAALHPALPASGAC